jgi:hypothetical protein
MPRNEVAEKCFEALNKAHKGILESDSNPTGVFVLVTFEDGDVARTAALSSQLNHFILIGALDSMKHSMLVDMQKRETSEYLGSVRIPR